MKKIIKLFLVTMFIFLLTGCLSEEEELMLEQLEVDVKPIFTKYLSQHYNISEIRDFDFYFKHNEYGTNMSDLTDYATASFNKDNDEYIIVCNYKTQKCYDSYAYKTKINPILVNKISEDINSVTTKNINKPDYILLKNNISRMAYTGIFDYSEKVNTYDDVINYYTNNKEFEIQKYISFEMHYYNKKIISKYLDEFKLLQNKLNNSITVIDYSDEGVENEYLSLTRESYGESDLYFYANTVKEMSDYIIYWKSIEIRDSANMIEYDNYKINIVDNNKLFDKNLKYSGTKYKLASNNVLVIEPSDSSKSRSDVNFIIKKQCDSGKMSKIFPKNKNIDYSISLTKNKYKHKYILSYRFDNMSAEKFALYCQKK